jgi:alcohol dehydrogenase class IV
MQLIAPNLRTVFHRARKRRCPRRDDEGGATLAGLAFSNSSVALVHGMSRPIGTHFHVPHGLSNAMLLLAVTEYSLNAAPERYRRRPAPWALPKQGQTTRAPARSYSKSSPH